MTELSYTAAPSRIHELRKLSAFVRRDLLVQWSYRLSFLTSFVGLFGGALVFYFVGKMVDPAAIPTVGGRQVSYLEFAVIGMTLGGFVHLGLERVSAALRNEQLMGTLESLLTTPTSSQTIQVGSILFDLIFIPLRMGLLLLMLGLVFGLGLDIGGVPQALVLLVFFMPFAWGLGILAAAITLTFRRGAGIVGLANGALTLISGLYFPLALLPNWLETVSAGNPLTIAASGLRESLLGSTGWGSIGGDILILLPLSIVSILVGMVAFRLALRRERRLGTLGAY
jgi:ABC-2 type transport system permease protein